MVFSSRCSRILPTSRQKLLSLETGMILASTSKYLANFLRLVMEVGHILKSNLGIRAHEDIRFRIIFAYYKLHYISSDLLSFVFPPNDVSWPFHRDELPRNFRWSLSQLPSRLLEYARGERSY